VGTFAAGVIQAHQGFSAVAMEVGIPSNAALLLWLLIVGVQMWRKAGKAAV